MAKFKVGDKVRVRRDLNIGECYSGVVFVKGMNKYKGEIIEIEDIADDDIVFLKDINFAWLDEMLEEVKEDKMEKTFREVIADIKPGEVWECKEINRQIVRGDREFIEIRKIDGRGFDKAVGLIVGNEKYKLQRKEYTFEEAFKALEEGKEIESMNTKYRYKKENGVYLYTLEGEEWHEEDVFEIVEIIGKWYIN